MHSEQALILLTTQRHGFPTSLTELQPYRPVIYRVSSHIYPPVAAAAARIDEYFTHSQIRNSGVPNIIMLFHGVKPDMLILKYVNHSWRPGP